MKTIFVLGDRNPAFVTHRAVDAVGGLISGVDTRWVGTDTADAQRTATADGLWVVPGSPYRDDAAVYAAIQHARTSGQPFLATCGGFQYAVVEFARHAAGIEDAEHAETAPTARQHVVSRLACSLMGQERMVTAVPGTAVYALCGPAPFVGFHWCNYGLSPMYVDRLVDHGMMVSARADDAGVEAVELPDHPFFLATLFQPQMTALSGGSVHPIIQGFVAAVSGVPSPPCTSTRSAV